MLVLALKMEDGSIRKIDPTRPIASLLSVLESNDVETIIAGQVGKKSTDWEKQFQAVTVMPSSFGKREKTK